MSEIRKIYFLRLIGRCIIFLLSILLAGLLSYLIAPAIAGAIPVNALSPDPLTGHVIAALAGVAIRSALSMVLYGLFMLIFTIVLRSVSAKVQPDKLITTEKPMRWLGLGVGLLSAVIFTLLWLSPLYGSFAAFSPVAANIMAIREAPGVPNRPAFCCKTHSGIRSWLSPAAPP